MRYRPSQAVRRFDRQTRRWIAGGISAPRGWFPAGRLRDWPGRLVRVTRRDPCQHRGNGQGGLQVSAFSPMAIGPGGGRFIHRPRPPAPEYREPYEREARENRKPSLIPRNHPSVVLPSARARSRAMRPELELEGAGITAGGMTCGCGRAGCGSVPAGGSAMLRSCVVTVGPTRSRSQRGAGY